MPDMPVMSGMLSGVAGATGLASMTAAMAAEPSGWMWAKTVPSVLTKAAWPAMPM